MLMKRIRLALLVLALGPSAVSAQVGGPDVVDRLVAIVGDSVVVATQVQEEIQRMALGGAPVPTPDDPRYQELFRQILDQYVDRLLILQAAARDSLIQVDEGLIEERVNERIEQLQSEFGGQAMLQQALAAEALTLAEYREILTNGARTENIQQLYFQLHLRDATPVDVSEDELRERFQEASAQLSQRPRLLTMRQVVVAPEPTESAVEAARAEAESLFERVQAGEDFAELAREYSDDPGSAQLGGDLGWFRRGRMVREFEDAAFGIFDGLVNEIVETDFGFHIIKVERYRAGERQARHILIVPEKTDADLERARELADDILEQARTGATMAELAESYSDPAAPDSLTFPFDQLGELPPEYGVLRSATTGQYVGPIEYRLPTGESRIAIVHVIEVREAGAYTFEDVKAQLTAQVQQEKQIEQLLAALRARTYIDIRM
jgi:peptidyl-prolyl cis-trans isomerase SurA